MRDRLLWHHSFAVSPLVRSLLCITMYSIMGAALTAAFALCRAAMHPDFGIWTASGAIPDPRLARGLDWNVARIDVLGASLVWASEGTSSPDYPRGPIADFMPAWSSLLSYMALNEDGTPTPDDAVSGTRYTQAGFGWPLIAMRATWTPEKPVHGIALAPDNGRPRYLPTEILPLRFAVNSAFYALCCWLAFLACGRSSRFLRQRSKGHCVQCGYSLAGITTTQCPECGAALQDARSAP